MDILTVPSVLARIRDHANQKEMCAELSVIRRKIHANPELGNHEFATQKLILDELEALGGSKTFVFVRKVMVTGVVALLRGGLKSDDAIRTVLLRGDMDALPMPDKKECDYKSQNEGVCHACGHDVHVTCLLGAVRLLVAQRDQFAGRVLFVFQPAEEIAGGGRRMVSLGVCGDWISEDGQKRTPSLLKVLKVNKDRSDAENTTGDESEHDDTNDSDVGSVAELADPVVNLPPSDVIPGSTQYRRRAGWVDGHVDVPTIDLALSMHVDAQGDVGSVTVKYGPTYASSDDFHVTIMGRGGHASAPHLVINPVFVAAQVILAMNSVVNQGVSSHHTCVLTVTRCQGGTNNNIIPDECVIEGTLRTQNNALRDELCERLPLVCRLTALSFGAAANVVFTRSFAAGSNATPAARLMQDVAGNFATAVYESDFPAMGSEDFYEFGLGGRVPAAMFWLGGRNEETGMTFDNHNSRFDIDESCLPVGAAVMAGSAVRFLRKGFAIKGTNRGRK